MSNAEEETLDEERMRVKIGPVDPIISGGDLSEDYLSYVSTIYGAPLFYVRGNHPERNLAAYEKVAASPNLLMNQDKID